MNREVRPSGAALDSELAVNSQTPMRAYAAPSIRVMDEQEVLSAFQVTVAATSWWTM